MTPRLILCALALAVSTPAATQPDAVLTQPVHAGTMLTSTPAGSALMEAPRVAPGAPRAPTPTIAELRGHLEVGRSDDALHAASRIVEEARSGRDRTLASMVLGMLYRERNLPNLASEAFTRVRLSRTPLAEWGAYFEAEQDHKRGRPWVAVRECRKVRERWPEGRFFDACRRLEARALVDTGRTKAARDMVAEYDKDYPDSPIEEQIELAIARRWMDTYPKSSRDLLRKLAIEHKQPLTGRLAEQSLAELKARGVEGAEVPDDTPSLMKRAVSLREAKRKQEAWQTFQELMRRSADNPRLARWVSEKAARFGWRTHQWDFLATYYTEKYKEDPDDDVAWNAYRVLDRGGRFTEATTWIAIGQKKHGKSRAWRKREESAARTYMLAKDYKNARKQFTAAGRHGRWSGRRARMYAGFAAYMDKDYEDAVKRLGDVISERRGYLPHAHYWRAKALDKLGRTEEAAEDRAWVLEHEPRGWYALQLRERDRTTQGPPWDRVGRWADVPPPSFPEVTRKTRLDRTPTAMWTAPSVIRHDASPWATLTWPIEATQPIAHVAVEPEPVSAVFRDPLVPAPSYRPSRFYDPEASRRALDKMARKHGGDWPEWRTVRDLASVGLYDLSGPMMSELYEEWRKAWRSPRHPHHRAARGISTKHEDWRELFYAARDHHHTDRFTFGMWDTVDSEREKRQALELGWPLAHDRYVWEHARENDVDPYLVMAVMRVESRYDAIARSRVGARGAMQIMPRTGALIADLKHDIDYTHGDLEDPIFAVGYGIFYLGKLMDRFDGAYPMAVASYNGGPFNTSAWLKGAGDLPPDEFVEHIPFRETRRYVRSVSAAYDTYVSLYGDKGGQVLLPKPPYADNPHVVDF